MGNQIRRTQRVLKGTGAHLKNSIVILLKEKMQSRVQFRIAKKIIEKKSNKPKQATT